ncbi:S8 family serine peptidase [Lentzea sp. DG1S-22]|uniref:S8 family serine peptidase n=1 Tax=Lentzea sp. DG1S-22 TaxID=3108822 RepID=UPI002E796E69|nr:S8 family serine peptidase [Lentzea sp. DG1S-22]WVH82389.1 S8 family serine peptidase [Lentzea sp. DG1S-22]
MSRRNLQILLTAVLTAGCLPLPVRAAHAQDQCAGPEEKVVEAPSWAQRRMGADRAWQLTEGGVVVGVVDTGVSAGAAALANAVLPGTDLSTGKGPGNADCSGHGTFLASLIAARQQEGTTFAGIAPGATLLPVRVTDKPSEVDPVKLAAGIRTAADGGARVIAVGLTTHADHPDLRAAVAHAQARDVVVVASAAAKEKGGRAYPAATPGVLAVAPLTENGAAGTAVLGAEPALAAPAENLVGAGPFGGGHRVGSASELGVAYVAGAAALVRAYHPTLSARDVTSRLLSTADRPAGAVPHPGLGHGVVNPVAAVTTLLPVTATSAPRSVEPLVIARATPPDPAPASRALWFAGTLLIAALLLAGMVRLLTRRRRRGGDSPTTAEGNPR